MCAWKYDEVKKVWGVYSLVHMDDKKADPNVSQCCLGMLRGKQVLDEKDMYK